MKRDQPKVTTIRVTATDAGVPVKGATVTLGSHRASTNAAGRATFRIKVTGTLIARVTHAGYLEGGAELTVAG